MYSQWAFYVPHAARVHNQQINFKENANLYPLKRDKYIN